MSGLASMCEVISGAVACAAVLTALATHNAGPEKRTVEATTEGPPPVSQPVRQEGTVVAVSANSVTARSADGYTQTYLVTPNTTVVTRKPTAHFAVNDQVDIVGTIRGDTALATAVADRDAGHGDGAPMDFVAEQSAR